MREHTLLLFFIIITNMSTYVRNVLKALAANHKMWSDEAIRVEKDLLKCQLLTVEDLEYILRNSLTRTNGLMREITIHPLATFEWLMDLEYHKDDDTVHWDVIVRNPNVTTETVETHSDLYWDWQYMHLLKDLNVEFVLRHINEWWNWREVARLFTFEDCLTLRGVVELATTLDAGAKLPNICLDSYDFGLSSNGGITTQNVVDHPEINWDLKTLLKSTGKCSGNTLGAR
jgi:hypothetical protein